MMEMLRKLLFILTAVCCLHGTALASYGNDEIVIKDVSGVIRSVTQIGKPATVEFSITDAAGMPADGAQIILKNDSGLELSGVSVNGVVVFDDVPAGSWTVSSASPDITFTNIMVSSAYVAVAGGSAAALASVLGGGGAVAGGAIAISYGTRGNPDHELSPHK